MTFDRFEFEIQERRFRQMFERLDRLNYLQALAGLDEWWIGGQNTDLAGSRHRSVAREITQISATQPPAPHSTLMSQDSHGRFWYMRWDDDAGLVVSRPTWTDANKDFAQSEVAWKDYTR